MLCLPIKYNLTDNNIMQKVGLHARKNTQLMVNM